MKRLPDWFKQPLDTDARFGSVQKTLKCNQLHTVCQSALCPNRHACWNSGTATFMIMGDVCTRNCGFCAVKTGRPEPLDAGEPERLAHAVEQMALDYVVITSVTRDDLPDEGAAHFSEVIRNVKQMRPSVHIEVLTPDFHARPECLARVSEAGPDVFNHNLETVKRLQVAIRPQASYETSLKTLRQIADQSGAIVKSGLMLGLGETGDEVREAFEDLREAGCEVLTLGQYLPPSRHHVPLVEYVHPDRFFELGQRALAAGFSAVASAPLVRSSYQAADLYRAALEKH